MKIAALFAQVGLVVVLAMLVGVKSPDLYRWAQKKWSDR